MGVSSIMDIKNLIKDTREILSLNKYNDDQVILSDVDNNLVLENAIYDYRQKSLEIFGQNYIDNILLEEMIFDDSNIENLEIIEESVIESLKNLKNSVAENIKNLWKKFKEWITNIINSIKKLFVKEKEIKIEVEVPKVKVNHEGIKNAMDEADKVMKKVEANDKKIKKIAYSNDLRSIKLKENKKFVHDKFKEKSNKIKFTSYLYKLDGDKFMDFAEKIGQEGERIVYADDDAYESSSFHNVKGQDVRNAVMKILPGSHTPSNLNEHLRSYIASFVRDKEKKEHMLGDYDVDELYNIAFDSQNIVSNVVGIRTYYDKWFSKTITEVNQSDDDKKIKRISDVCKESMKYVTMIIKIFVSEYRAAAITCRRILLAGVR